MDEHTQYYRQYLKLYHPEVAVLIPATLARAEPEDLERVYLFVVNEDNIILDEVPA